MTTAKHKVQFSTGRRAKKADKTYEAPTTRIPRVTKMMALAIRFDHLIKTGQVKDQAELARLAHVSRARVTQIMDLLLLGPDIQEIIITATEDLANVNERCLQTTSKLPNWKLQRTFLEKRRTN